MGHKRENGRCGPHQTSENFWFMKAQMSKMKRHALNVKQYVQSTEATNMSQNGTLTNPTAEPVRGLS